MHKLRSFRTVLILMLILTIFLIYGNAAAQCPNDPCPQQTQSGEIVDNEDMNLKWAPGHPPDSFDSNGQAILEVINGTGEYTWEIDADDDATFGDGHKVESTFRPDLENIVTLGDSADCSIAVTVSNKGTTLGPANISNRDESFKFDFAQTGSGTIARNSARTIYISGGTPPFTWTTSTSGFYFDSARTQKQITTDTRNVVLYSNNSACGTAIIQITDQCGVVTEGNVRCSEGRYTNYKTVGTANTRDICPYTSGCASGGNIYNISCDKLTNRYDYFVDYTQRFSGAGCGEPGCDASSKPLCNRKGVACRLTVDDGICKYTYQAPNCKGVCSITLIRGEWKCN